MRDEPNQAAIDAKSAALLRQDCVYPDWEGGYIIGKHSFDKNGFCGICGYREKNWCKRHKRPMKVYIDQVIACPDCETSKVLYEERSARDE